MSADDLRPDHLVAGLGRAGQAAAQALLRDAKARRVVVWDAASTPATNSAARALRRSGAEVWLGGDGSTLIPDDGGVCVVKSPGIPDEAPVLTAARASGAEIIDELEYGWRHVSRPVAAVTGTNGKSTTARLLLAALEAAGLRARLAGNTEFGPPLSAFADQLSAPASIDHGGGGATIDYESAGTPDWIVCETSSFQLEHSPTFLPEVAVFTNLTPEHLDRHGSMERYGAAKAKMFLRRGRTAGLSVVNLDDPFGAELADGVLAVGGTLLSYGFSPGASVRIDHAEWDLSEAELVIRASNETLRLHTRLPGAHNARNVAAAVAVGLELGASTQALQRHLGQASPPEGRWQPVDAGQPFDVLVDYAHTPDGIVQALSAIRAPLRERGGRLLTVFGPVGLPDSDKARGTALALSRLSDELVLCTGSAPRSHRLLRMAELRDVAREARNGEGGGVRMVIERRAAIEQTISMAEPGDAVAILGLGALPRLTLDPAGSVMPHSDVEVARAALLNRRQTARRPEVGARPARRLGVGGG